MYDELGVDNFIQYISAYAARLIINILSFILTFVIITVVMRAIIFALDIVASLPCCIPPLLEGRLTTRSREMIFCG